MAHNLHIENGKASMMYVDEPPWHGLGTRLDRPATAAEAIKVAGLDWEVVKKPLWAMDNTGRHKVPDRFAIVREDWFGTDNPIFGIVGRDYTPLQNRTAFGFFDSIVGQGAAAYHTAGALGAGERVWILAKLPGNIQVIGDDITEKYMLLSNSHDGTSAVQVKFTPIRVVCQNTLTMALRDGQTVRIPHMRSLKARMDQTADLLGIVGRRFTGIETSFKAMATRRINAEQLDHYLQAVFPDPQDITDERAMARMSTNRRLTVTLFETGKGTDLPGVRGTLWAAYNAVAEFTDHRPPQRGNGSAQERRLEAAWFGEGCSAKVRAYREACALLSRSN